MVVHRLNYRWLKGFKDIKINAVVKDSIEQNVFHDVCNTVEMFIIF